MKKISVRFIRRITNTVLTTLLFTFVGISAQAANGTWINTTSGGLWNNSANWSGGTIANGAGSIAVFSSIDITADNTVHLNTARILTGLVFGDTATNSPAGWILDNNGNSANNLTLSNGLITVSPLGGTKVATISVILIGTNSLTKSGPGTLVLSAANTYTGNTTISNGTLTLNGSGAIDNSPLVSVASGATFSVPTGYTVNTGHTLTGAGSVLNGAVTVNSGGTLVPGSGGVGTFTLGNLTLNSGAINNFELTGTGTNDLVIATNLALNGGAINLYQVGTTAPFTTPGTYNLFQYSGGSIGGAGTIALSVANPQPDFIYDFGDTGTNVTITISALTAPPTRISAYSVDGSILAVHFSEQVQTASASNPANYTIYTKALFGGGVNVTNAVLLQDEQTVVLRVDSSVSEFYAVGVSNVLDLSSNNIVADATSYLGDWIDTNIGTGGDPATDGSVTAFYRDAMQVTANGSDIGGTNDHCHYIYDKITGNFSAVANFTRLNFTDREAKACIMARDSVATGSRTVAVGFTPLVPGPNTNRVVLLVRTNSNSAPLAFGDPPQLNSLGWLRLTRTNTVFRAFYGTNGVDWVPCGALTNGSFSNTMHVGVAVTSHTNGHDTVAAVNNFGVAGERPGAGVLPSLSINIVSNQGVAKWQRTPQDFTVQVTDSLVGNSSGSASNTPPVWSYVLRPVFDTSLTGTNAFMPTSGRYMTFPLNLFSNSAMYVRLTRVERLIPDPVGVTPGLILSQAAGNMVGNPSTNSTLNGYNINTNNSVIIHSTNYLVLSPTNKYTFTSEDSTNLRTVMVIKKLKSDGTSVVVTNNGGIGGLSVGGKAIIAFTPTATNHTVILAATNGVTPTETSPLRLRIEYK